MNNQNVQNLMDSEIPKIGTDPMQVTTSPYLLTGEKGEKTLTENLNSWSKIKFCKSCHKRIMINDKLVTSFDDLEKITTGKFCTCDNEIIIYFGESLQRLEKNYFQNSQKGKDSKNYTVLKEEKMN